jgi:hypothetical protein
VLADQAYGGAEEFREGIRTLGLHYAVAVDARSVVQVLDKRGRRSHAPVNLKKLAHTIDANGGFRRHTWRQGTKQPLSARFALRRVVWVGRSHHGQADVEQREPVWLLIEWRDDEPEYPPDRDHLTRSGLDVVDGGHETKPTRA